MDRKFWWICFASALIIFSGLVEISVDPVSAMEDSDCLECHGDISTIEDFNSCLYINPSIFATTAHAEVGCTACHDSVSDDHPDDGLKPAPVKCSQCHEEVAEEYKKSVHADNAECTSCHNPHEVKNPMCVSGVDENRPCAKCHEPASTVSQHAYWLPRTRLHMNSLPCIACHTGSKNYVITLYIVKDASVGRKNISKTTTTTTDNGKTETPTPVGVRVTNYDDLASIIGSKNIQSLLDRNADGFVSMRELKKFTTAIKKKKLRLWGMFMPEVVTHSYQILDNRWDCSFCHASGPKAMQKSYVAIPGKDGSFQRLPVEKGAVMDTLFGTPDFYMLGASRSRPLTILGLVIVAGGALMPLVHGTVRFITRNNRKRGHDNGTKS